MITSYDWPKAYRMRTQACSPRFRRLHPVTGVDLSKILGATKILGGGAKGVAIVDKIIGVSQLLETCARVTPHSTRLCIQLFKWQLKAHRFYIGLETV